MVSRSSANLSQKCTYFCQKNLEFFLIFLYKIRKVININQKTQKTKKIKYFSQQLFFLLNSDTNIIVCIDESTKIK